MAEKDLTRGVIAGIIGGLAAAWVLNEFVAGPGKRIAARLQDESPVPALQSSDAAFLHYGIGAAMGGVYGGLAEYVPAVTAGHGTTFGGLAFASTGLLETGESSEEAKPALATPFAAHVVFGFTTELVRRLVRKVL